MLFDDDSCVLCPSCLVLRRNPINRSNKTIKTRTQQSNQSRPPNSRSRSRVEIPEANTQSAREGPFSADGRVSCLGLSNLLRPACSTYKYSKRGRSWGFQVRFLFFLPLQLSCRLACAVAARRAADDRGLEELEREAGQ